MDTGRERKHSDNKTIDVLNNTDLLLQQRKQLQQHWGAYYASIAEEKMGEVLNTLSHLMSEMGAMHEQHMRKAFYHGDEIEEIVESMFNQHYERVKGLVEHATRISNTVGIEYSLETVNDPVDTDN